MRRIVSWLLVGIGAFLLVTAGLLQWYAPGKALRVPLNVDSTTRLSGEATKLNPATGKLEDLPVKVTSVTKVDPDKSDDDVVVWVNTVCAVIDERDVPDCVTKDDDRLISASDDVFASDRRTGELIENAEEYIDDRADGRTGLMNKWPFGAKKRNYEVWDGLLKEPVIAEFQDEEDLDGVTVYVYKSVVPETDAEILTDVQGIYSQEKTYYIEPVTGAILNQQQHEVRKLENGDLVLDMAIEFTPEQVEVGVSDAKENLDRLELFFGPGKYLAAGLGLVALLGGLALLMLDRRKV